MISQTNSPVGATHGGVRRARRGPVRAALTLLLVISAGGISAQTPAGTAALSAEAVEFFEKKIRPVLVTECYECHGAEKQKGGLRLDFRDGWKKGGDSGEAIIAGDVKKSLLLQTIRHEDPELKMPSKAPKLTNAVIADFEKWVAMGAPDPRDAPAREGDAGLWERKLEERKKWWSLQSVREVEPPAVKQPEWSAHPVDRFLLAQMETRELAPAPNAEARVVFRRLSYALTGLPPSADDAAAFERDARNDAQQAIEAATDRLLATPAYGERWARHWQDLMRYAETHGSEGDPEIPEAWRYRDYLIRAFNEDVPFDQFIRESLAGDLLAKPRINRAEGWNESMLGPAHLRLVEHGFMPVDTLDEQVKVVDNQIDVISKAFLGMTVSCARCHDHKFDAISQRDFTALFGVLASVRPAQVTIDTPEVLAKGCDTLAALKPRVQEALAAVWMESAKRVPEQLLDQPRRGAQMAKLRELITEREKSIAALEWNARRQLANDGAPAQPAGPAPFARWAFEQDAKDEAGALHGELLGGAAVRNGRLVLNGKGAFLRTAPISTDLREKTLEAWVSLATLDQAGGGVVAVEAIKKHGFDAIVFGEKNPRLWIAGSDFFNRSAPTGGAPESAVGELVHVAIAYRGDSSIAMYRNGRPHGRPYSQGTLLAYQGGDARVLLGLRHTGAGNGFLAGEIEEARLYARALSDDEVAASFEAGTGGGIPPHQIEAALTAEQRAQRTSLLKERDELRAQLAAFGKAADGKDAWSTAIAEAAKDPANPLAAWARMSHVAPGDFAAEWSRFVESAREVTAKARAQNAERFSVAWDLSGADYTQWFRHGSGLAAEAAVPGSFAVEPSGELAVRGLLPGGAATHLLSPKQNGVLTSPRFQISSDNISVRAAGGGGAQVRVIVDNYPLGTKSSVFTQITLDSGEPKWIRLDTAYRKGSWAYLEFTTHRDATRIAPKAKDAKADDPSWFSVDRVVFHAANETPADERHALDLILQAQPTSVEDLAAHYGRLVEEAVSAWRAGTVSEAQRELLDFFLRRGLLPNDLPQLGAASAVIAEYRKHMDAVPVPRRAPGVLEGTVYDAPFMTRGDHLQPGEPVPRAFLAVLDPRPFGKAQSGRLELANAIADPKNPLTARVFVNRVWHHIFGQGLVPTVDNFGRLGEMPTHPELLDYLAQRFVAEGWSVKKLVRLLVTTRAFRLSSQPSAEARERDPGNALLSHARVRRLDAESLRDTLMTLSGQLDRKMFGPPEGGHAARRSIYLSVRRNALNPFLTVFDAPKPFTALGRRDDTNVPGQSLTLLNDPFVIQCATRWAERSVRLAPEADLSARLHDLFSAALSRKPTAAELAATEAYAAELRAEHRVAPEMTARSVPVLRDLAQSVFNFKEFLYLR